MSDDVKRKLTTALDKIGRSNGLAYPESRVTLHGLSNEDADRTIAEDKAVYELMLAREIATYADKRKKSAEAKITSMSIYDSSKARPGTTTQVYDGPVMTVLLKVNNPARRLDESALREKLRLKGGLAPTLIAEIIEASKIEAKPAVVPTIAMKEV